MPQYTGGSTSTNYQPQFEASGNQQEDFWGGLNYWLTQGVNPWQAKYVLQYIFSRPELFATKAHGKTGTAALIRSEPGSPGYEWKKTISKLTGIASGGTTPEEQQKFAVLGQTEIPDEGGSRRGDQPPAGWHGLQSIISKGEWSPFGSHLDYLNSLFSGKNPTAQMEVKSYSGKPMLIDPVKKLMEDWGASNYKEFDALTPVVENLQKEDKQRQLEKSFYKDYGSVRGPAGMGDSGFGAFMSLASMAIPMAAGGSMAGIGKAVGGGARSAVNIASRAGMATGASNAMNLAQTMAGGVNIPSQAFLSSWNIPLAQSFMGKLGTGLGEAGYNLSPNLWGSREGFERWWNEPNVFKLPESDLGARRVSQMVAGERGVPSYYPEPWKKQIMWSKLYGEYPDPMKEQLRTSLFNYNPYGYGNYYWGF